MKKVIEKEHKLKQKTDILQKSIDQKIRSDIS